jgi:hypothetical protein
MTHEFRLVEEIPTSGLPTVRKEIWILALLPLAEIAVYAERS